MSMQFSRFAAAGLAGAFLLAAGAASAQQAPAPAAPAAPAQPGAAAPQGGNPGAPFKADLVAVQPNWTKVCGKDPQAGKEICYTTRDFGPQADQPLLALAIYDLKGEPNRVIKLLLPPGLKLKPGFRFAVDKGQFEQGAFDICFPNGCFAEATVKGPTVDAMKKGDKMTVIVKNQVGAEVTFLLPLNDFGKAFDGPPIDPKVLEEQQKKLQDELQKRAEEERKKIEAAKAAGGAAPAPAKPAGK